MPTGKINPLKVVLHLPYNQQNKEEMNKAFACISGHSSARSHCFYNSSHQSLMSVSATILYNTITLDLSTAVATSHIWVLTVANRHIWVSFWRSRPQMTGTNSRPHSPLSSCYTLCHKMLRVSLWFLFYHFYRFF